MYELFSTVIKGLLHTVGLSQPTSDEIRTYEQQQILTLLASQYPSIFYNNMNDLSKYAIAYLQGFRGTRLLTDRRGRHTAIAIADFLGPSEWEKETKQDLQLAIKLAGSNLFELERVNALFGRPRWPLTNRQGPNNLAHSLLNWSGVQAAYQTLKYFGYRLPNLHREIGNQGVEHFLYLLTDIFPPCNSHIQFEHGWRTQTCQEFARQIYAEDSYTAMPIFADLIEDSGCCDEIILNHCRGPNMHVRGCWVIDLFLDIT